MSSGALAAFGVLDDARARQRRRQRRLRYCAVGAALIAAGLISIVSTPGGGKSRGPGTTTISSVAQRPIGKGATFRLPRGHAEASFSVNEPAGLILLAQISVPTGARAFMNATTVGGAVRVTTWGAVGLSLACSTHGGTDVCKQLMEPCPFGAAVWRLRVVKLSGPAGLVRVKLGFKPSSAQI
jgi:hypothetical protein